MNTILAALLWFYAAIGNRTCIHVLNRQVVFHHPAIIYQMLPGRYQPGIAWTAVIHGVYINRRLFISHEFEWRQ